MPEGHLETPSSAAGPLEGLLDGEARQVLVRALERLPDEQSAVFTLRVFEDLSYKEIADALAINLGTVMSRLSRARERLRAEIASYLGPAGQRAEGRR